MPSGLGSKVKLGFSKTTHRKEDESLPQVLISMNVFIIVKKLKEPVAYGTP
jgi:hypothetical protein